MKRFCLALFFTRGVSLETWEDNGSLHREVAVYQRLQQQGIKVIFVTYGGQRDLEISRNLPGVKVLCNHWNLPRRLYEALIPVLFWRELRDADLIKTNQMNGADVALWAAKLLQKPLIARFGFMWSEFAEMANDFKDVRKAQKIEARVFSRAAHIVVTTVAMKESIEKKYGIRSQKISIIPNYVLTDIFCPLPTDSIKNRVCFIGRLVDQKNLVALVNACEGLDIDLQFVGQGELRGMLEKIALEKGVRLTIQENIPHNQLPSLICSSVVFAMPSLYEGHPKALLEAMSCGVAVLGADSPGVREQIIHNETGWLTGGDAPAIHEGLKYLLAHSNVRDKIGRNARNFILKNYSVEHVAEVEALLLESILYGEKQ